MLGKRTYDELAPNWKCVYKENVLDITRDLVTGRRVYILQFQNCYDTRRDERGCGPTGKWFKKYEYIPQNSSSLNLGGKKKQASNAEDLLAELEKDT